MRAPNDFKPSFGYRDYDTFRMIEREVLAKNRRALIIIGGAHLTRDRKHAADTIPLEKTSIGQALDRLHHGVLFSVLVISGQHPLGRTLGWPAESFARLRGTALGAKTTREVVTNEYFRVRVVDGKRQLTPFRPDEYPSLESAGDGLLFLGPKDRTIFAGPDAYDNAYQAELRRRADIYKTVFGYDWDPEIELAARPAPSQRRRETDPRPGWTDSLRQALIGARGAAAVRSLIAEESREELGVNDTAWRPDELGDVRDLRLIARDRIADPELRMNGALVREVAFYELVTGSDTKFVTIWITANGMIAGMQVTRV